MTHALPIPPSERDLALNHYVDLLVKTADATPFTWEEKVAALMLASARVLATSAPLKGRRGAVIKAVVEDFRIKLQAVLPF